MANAFRKLTNGNKAAIILDWFNSPTNRSDILYFNMSEMNGNDLVHAAFGANVLVTYTPFDANTGQITFQQILT